MYKLRPMTTVTAARVSTKKGTTRKMIYVFLHVCKSIKSVKNVYASPPTILASLNCSLTMNFTQSDCPVCFIQ